MRAIACIIWISLGVYAISAQKDASSKSSVSTLVSWDMIKTNWTKHTPAEIRQAAETGDPQAQCFLAWLHQDGIGVQTNHDEAVKWMTKAAEQNFAVGQNMLGWAYEEGMGVREDRQEAMRWIRLAADQGYMPAEISMGYLYNHGKAKPGEIETGNFVEAAEWYEKAARKGSPEAQFYLAELYHYGKLGDALRPKAVEWFHKSALQGFEDALEKYPDLRRSYPKSPLLNDEEMQKIRQIAEAKKRNSGNTSRLNDILYRPERVTDPALAIEQLKEIVAHESKENMVAGLAALRLGEIYESGEWVPKNEAEALSWYAKAAQSSDEGLYRLAWMYEAGRGVTADPDKAASYYRQSLQKVSMHTRESIEALFRIYAAGRGLPGNQTEAKHLIESLTNPGTPETEFNLGRIYFDAKVIPQDMEKAIEHFSRSAQQKYAPAQNSIGEMWARGEIETKDEKQAARWFRQAADQGFAPAQLNLGSAYLTGTGEGKDLVNALKWLIIAAKGGNSKAIQQRNDLQQTMSTDQISEAKKAAEAFSPKPMVRPASKSPKQLRELLED